MSVHCASNGDCEKLNSNTLTCKASGFPEPEYKWSFSGGKVIGPTVIAKKNIVYQGTATNHYADQPHSAASTLQAYWLNIPGKSTLRDDVNNFSSVNLGISGPACISLLVIVIFFGLNLVCFTVFIICYGCSENGRKTLNDRFPWLKKMLPCINGDGCIRFEWIFLFAIISIFASIIFFPTIIIVANCCGKKKKSNQGLNSGDINLRQEVYVYENAVRANAAPETTSYESLQRPTAQLPISVYEELTQTPDFLTQREC